MPPCLGTDPRNPFKGVKSNVTAESGVDRSGSAAPPVSNDENGHGGWVGGQYVPEAEGQYKRFAFAVPPRKPPRVRPSRGGPRPTGSS